MKADSEISAYVRFLIHAGNSGAHFASCGGDAMMRLGWIAGIVVTMVAASPSVASSGDPILPPGDPTPLLRLETGGPRSYVSGLAFAPNGSRLYSVGWDKAVQTWDLNEAGRFEYNPMGTLRIPIGGGLLGGLNAIALSEDGTWLATAGRGFARNFSGERDTGWVLPSGNYGRDSQLDNGLIYVFNTTSRVATLLRGHRGAVFAVAFVRGSRTAPPELVSVAEEWTDNPGESVPVVRYWDVQQATEISSLRTIPNSGAKSGDAKNSKPLPGLMGFRPTVTAWSHQEIPHRARVALAWGDDQFRIWDSQTGQVSQTKSNPNLLALVPISARGDRLMTGAHGEIGVWSIPSAQNAPLPVFTRQQFQLASTDSVNGRSGNVPMAGDLIRSKNGTVSHVAFVVTHYLDNEHAEYRLLIASAESPFKTIRDLKLSWEGSVRQPAIAVSNDGQTLAIAGHEKSHIEIYSVNDLIQGREVQPQRLESSGISLQSAEFVRSEDSWGLKLTDSSGKPNSKPLVFDIDRRRIEPTIDKWKPSVVDVKGWQRDTSKVGKVVVRPPGKADLELTLETGCRATHCVICPPTGHCPVPLVAVASQSGGQPMLQLFNGENGESLRWYVGHTGVIRSLSFSDDGRMLVTAAEDRTVCVWTTTDLVERNLGKHGRIPGLSVRVEDQRLMVVKAAMNLAFKVGDEIVSTVRNSEVLELGTRKEFYNFVLARRPEETVEFTIRRGGQIQTVRVGISQAIDEAKPLFSLFVSSGDNASEWEWIAWNPSGSFDSRGDRVDQWLGWHFNTGDAKRPAKFAAVGEYRDAFYRRDLIKQLIELQKLPPVAMIQEDPKVSFLMRQPDGTALPTDYDGVYQVEAHQVEIVAEALRLSDPRKIQGFSVSIDGSDPVPLKKLEEGGDWVADLSQFQWHRGTHRLQVTMNTIDQTVTTTKFAEFRPGAPKIDWKLDPRWKDEHDVEKVVVRAFVEPKSEPIRTQLIRQRPGQEDFDVIRTWDSAAPIQIDEDVSLEPGENRLEIRCWNATAPDARRQDETMRVSHFVRRTKPLGAPRISIDEVRATKSATEHPLLTADGEAYNTAWPSLVIRGTIVGQHAIGEAVVTVEGKQRPLTGFQPGKINKVVFEESLSLRAGRQSILIQSAIQNAREEKRIVVVYQPPVPRIEKFSAVAMPIRELPKSAALQSDQIYFGFHEQFATITATLTGQLEHPYRVSFRNNGETIEGDFAKIDTTRNDNHQLTARIPLNPMSNAISLRLENEWNQHVECDAIELNFRRPPEILALQAEQNLIEQPLDLTCRIRSAVPIRSTKILVDDLYEIPSSTTIDPDEQDTYVLRTEKTGLAEGTHQLKIFATNDDGATLIPAFHTIVVRQSEKPPKLTIVGPAVNGNFSQRQLEIEYRVDAVGPTSLMLKIRRSDGSVVENEIAAESVPIDGSIGEISLELSPGQNDIELVARGLGGFSEREILTVSHVPQPATVEIVSVDNQRPQLKQDGTAYFEKSIPKARVELRGTVTIHEGIQAHQKLKARVWVNSFMVTTDVVIDDTNPRAGTFRTAVTLSRQRKNEIKVEVYSNEGRMASVLDGPKMLTLDCDSPERGQDLYLVLLGTADADQLRDRALIALRAKASNLRAVEEKAREELWESDMFSRIHVFNALNINPVKAQHQLRTLVKKMNKNKERASSSGPESIVMVYFQGKINLSRDDFTFATVNSNVPASDAMTGKDLETSLNDTYGAHLLFLDLTQNSGNVTESDIWPKAPQLGVMVSNWTGDGEQPNETRLISALEQTLPQVRIVRDLASRIDQRYQISRAKFQDQIENRVDLLKGVQDVRFGVLD